jgi:hypothetical protein
MLTKRSEECTMPRSQTFKPGEYEFLLKLSPDLNLDLHAFCEVHFRAPKNEVARRALRAFLDTELAADPRGRRQFEEVRRRLAKENDLRLSVARGAKREVGQ